MSPTVARMQSGKFMAAIRPLPDFIRATRRKSLRRVDDAFFVHQSLANRAAQTPAFDEDRS